MKNQIIKYVIKSMLWLCTVFFLLAAKITVQSSGGTWIQESNGKWWYQFEDMSYPANEWEYINGAWYYFDSAGWMVTGWIQYNSQWYYCLPSGAMATGWHEVSYGSYMNGNPYWNYFNSSGEYVTDSDTEGCVHGKNTFNDYYNLEAPVLYYYIDASALHRKGTIQYAAQLCIHGITTGTIARYTYNLQRILQHRQSVMNLDML